MPQLTPQQFARVESLFFEAGQIPTEERTKFLDSACADDPHVREEVENMLRHSKGGESIAPLLPQVGQALSAPATRSVRAMIGQTLGAYVIDDVIGTGGMGVVYLAHDVRLDRQVAIKAVPAIFTHSPARLNRFTREARILASLSHPNIATVYGLEETADGRFLVMELVEGETLAARLDKGALPIEEALSVCCQIAEGVEAAHEAGVIHRDLKPGNVMFTTEGKIKVLDFGLAREISSSTVMEETTATPVETARPVAETKEGAVLGTPGYMSPEQVRGRAVDRRCDIFAFGCILYECLTGRPAFPGQSQADVIAAVLEREPDFAALPRRTPQRIRQLLARCTAKDLSLRQRDIGDVRLELDETIAGKEWQNEPRGGAPAAPPPPPPPPTPAWRRWMPWTVAAAGLLVAALAIGTALLKRPALPVPEARPLLRYSIPFPNNQPQADLAHLRIAVSRDGERIVMSASDGEDQHLWLRKRSDMTFRQLADTRGGWIPSFSPDGDWVVYYDGGVMSKRNLSGGSSIEIVDVSGYWGAYHWDTDDMINYVPFWSKGVARVSAQGGKPAFVTTPEYDNGDFAHISPVVMPDASAMVFCAWDGKQGTRIDAINLKTRERHNVVEQGSSPRIAQTPWGLHLLYERAGTIYAAPLDATTVTRTGPETPVADGVLFDKVLFAACYDVSDEGTLTYVPGPAFSEESRLTWLDPKNGETVPLNDDRMSFAEPVLSADGRTMSVLVKGDWYRPFIYDLVHNTPNRVVIDGDVISCAISPDGKKFAYSTNANGPYELWVRDLETRTDEKIVDGSLGDYHCPIAWSADNEHIAFSVAPGGTTARDVWTVSIKDKTPTAFCNSAAVERSPAFSPDGKWLAYVSNQSDSREIYLKSFPDGKQTRQITYDNGDWPMWSPDGSTIYYRRKGDLLSIAVEDGSAVGRPVIVYTKPFGQSDFDLPDFAVASDGRILLVEPSERGPKVSQINMVLNWYQLLPESARTPVKK